MNYRADIDGLRALAVISVIIFHLDATLLPGGFIGVDVFFVISGFLITSLILHEQDLLRFSYSAFYKRRITRLAPALALTLILVLVMGFLLYDLSTYDFLGKVVVFSAFGVANILFAQGMDYFAQDFRSQPLLHLWSLGVEEQFYVLWPAGLLVIARFKHKTITIFLLVAAFLAWSEFAAQQGGAKSYYYPQYRAFQLMIGALSAQLLRKYADQFESVPLLYKSLLSGLGLVLILGSMFVLTPESVFPGINALWPSLGTALLILFLSATPIGRFFSYRPMVFIGLISYPLYLFHLPIIVFFNQIYSDAGLPERAAVTLILGTILASATFFWIEKPLRQGVKSGGKFVSKIIPASLLCIIVAIGAAGLFVAKNNGIPARFALLNPFAQKAAEKSARTFHQYFQRGVHTASIKPAKILFVGDSILQQYIVPLATAWGIELSQIDAYTRGGCVLLKGVDFRDEFSDISCSSIVEALYENEKSYDVIVLSQDWSGYNQSLLNPEIPPETQDFALKKWDPFLKQTLRHFAKSSKNIVIIGAQINVAGTMALQPSMILNQAEYLKNMSRLQVTNLRETSRFDNYFDHIAKEFDIAIIKPTAIFCADQCTIDDGSWSYFSDASHIGAAATDFVADRLKRITADFDLNTTIVKQTPDRGKDND